MKRVLQSLAIYLTVCLDMELQIEENNDMTAQNDPNVRWDLGPCSSLNSYFENAIYGYESRFIERCCLAPGKYILSCYSSIPTRGWKNAFLMINGHPFCDNFIGDRLLQKIDVTGTILFITLNVDHIFCDEASN